MKSPKRPSIRLLIGVAAALAVALITIGCGQAEVPTASAAPAAQAPAVAPPPAVQTQLKPATFTVTDLIVDPQRANPGEEVTATAVIVNSGDVPGTYGFGLMVDGNITSIKQVSIRPGESVKISSAVTRDTAGVHTLGVGQLQSRFEVIPVVTKPDTAQSTGLASCCSPATAGQTTTSPASLPGCCAPGTAVNSPAPTPTQAPVAPKPACCGG